MPLALLALALGGCQGLRVPRDVASPADLPRCEGGVAGALETGLQVAGRKTERSFRLVGHVFFESFWTAGESLAGLLAGGPKRAAQAWEHGAKNVASVARHRAEQVEDAGRDLCVPQPESPTPDAPRPKGGVEVAAR